MGLIYQDVIAIPRANPELNEGLQEMEKRIVLAGADGANRAWNDMSSDGMEFICDQLMRCTEGPGIKGLVYFLSNFFFIKTKEAGFKPIYPMWDSQLMLLEKIDAKWLKMQAVWYLILKARQLGISTLVEGLVLWLTVFNKNWTSMLIADEPAQTEYIFEMARNGYESLPWWMRPEKRYDVKGHHMIFDRQNAEDRIKNPGLKSQILAESANQRSGIGYGKTVLCLHASEVPKYKDARILTEGILPTMPENNPHVVAILEGAAQKRHDDWHRMWKASEAGEMKFEPLFIPWFGERQYFAAPPQGWIPQPEIVALDKAIQREYQRELLPGQLFWYERKRNDYISFEGEDSTFLTQFPSNAHEAFQNAGICAFSKRKLHMMLLMYGSSKCWRGEIRLADNNVSPKLSFVADGRLKIWQFPSIAKRHDANAKFYVAGDPSGGTATGHPACWQVLLLPSSPFDPIVQVACWTGHAGPSQFARIGAALGYLYDNAELAPESNNMGSTVVADLKNVINYPYLYRWRREDKAKGYFSDFFGFLMTRQSKGSIISRMAEGLDEDMIIMQDPDTIDEGFDFISDDGQEYYAVSEDGHGDRMIACMIGYYCAFQNRPLKERSAERMEYQQQKRDKSRDFINTDHAPDYDRTVAGDAPQTEFMML